MATELGNIPRHPACQSRAIGCWARSRAALDSKIAIAIAGAWDLSPIWFNPCRNLYTLEAWLGGRFLTSPITDIRQRPGPQERAP